MNRVERHSLALADQADGVDDGIDADQARPPQRGIEVAREVDLHGVAGTGGPVVHGGDHAMTGRPQCLCKVLADEPARSGKEYNHPRLVLCRVVSLFSLVTASAAVDRGWSGTFYASTLRSP